MTCDPDACHYTDESGKGRRVGDESGKEKNGICYYEYTDANSCNKQDGGKDEIHWEKCDTTHGDEHLGKMTHPSGRYVIDGGTMTFCKLEGDGENGHCVDDWSEPIPKEEEEEDGGGGGGGGETVESCPIPCFHYCIDQYGGNKNQNFDTGEEWEGGTGDSYMCAKGCATMGSGKIGSHKYFDYDSSNWDEEKWTGNCEDKCDNASGSEKGKKICEYGCGFWKDNCLNDFCGAESVMQEKQVV